VAAWLHWRLLPSALTARGDRPTRVRALGLLRALLAAGCAPRVVAAGPGGRGVVWGGAQWSCLAELLHVLVGWEARGEAHGLGAPPSLLPL
jgi:hypothetical protein